MTDDDDRQMVFDGMERSSKNEYVGAKYEPSSDTSKEAAKSIVPHLTELHLKVLSVFTDQGDFGATCDEVEILTGLLHQTASARINELVDKKEIIKNGKKRRTRSKRRAAVYVIRPK